MLDPETNARFFRGDEVQGVPGIRAFAASIPTWHELDDPSWTARFAYQNVERRGTGGGAFRAMYADFLSAVAGTVSLPADAPERMAGVAADWTAVGETLYEASETDDPETFRALLAEAGADVDALADREAALYEDLLASL